MNGLALVHLPLQDRHNWLAIELHWSRSRRGLRRACDGSKWAAAGAVVDAAVKPSLHRKPDLKKEAARLLLRVLSPTKIMNKHKDRTRAACHLTLRACVGKALRPRSIGEDLGHHLLRHRHRKGLQHPCYYPPSMQLILAPWAPTLSSRRKIFFAARSLNT